MAIAESGEDMYLTGDQFTRFFLPYLEQGGGFSFGFDFHGRRNEAEPEIPKHSRDLELKAIETARAELSCPLSMWHFRARPSPQRNVWLPGLDRCSLLVFTQANMANAGTTLTSGNTLWRAIFARLAEFKKGSPARSPWTPAATHLTFAGQLPRGWFLSMTWDRWVVHIASWTSTRFELSLLPVLAGPLKLPRGVPLPRSEIFEIVPSKADSNCQACCLRRHQTEKLHHLISNSRKHRHCWPAFARVICLVAPVVVAGARRFAVGGRSGDLRF